MRLCWALRLKRFGSVAIDKLIDQPGQKIALSPQCSELVAGYLSVSIGQSE